MKIDRSMEIASSTVYNSSQNQVQRTTNTTESSDSTPVRSGDRSIDPVQAPHKKSSSDAKGNEADEDVVEKAVQRANMSLKQVSREISRDIHPVTKVVMYKIKDTKTGDVIAEFPPKKIEDMIAKMWELAGLFVDEKA